MRTTAFSVDIPNEVKTAQCAVVRRLEERHRKEIQKRRHLREEVFRLRNQVSHLTHENHWLSFRLHGIDSDNGEVTPVSKSPLACKPSKLPLTNKRRVADSPPKRPLMKTLGRWIELLKQRKGEPVRENLQAKCQSARFFGASPPIYGMGLSPSSLPRQTGKK